MKLLDIMKKYDRCLVRESAKLTKIYNMLLKEAAADDECSEGDACPECGNCPCTCESDKCTETEVADVSSDEGIDECGIIPEKDFFETEDVEENDMLRNRPHNAHIDDPRGVVSEDDGDKIPDEEFIQAGTGDDAEEEEVSAEEFFGESEEDDDGEEDAKAKKEAEDAEPKAAKKTKKQNPQMQSAAEFFAEAEKECKEESEDEDVSEAEITAKMVPVEAWLNQFAEAETETDEADEEKELQESLKSYRRKNHRLFNS